MANATMVMLLVGFSVVGCREASTTGGVIPSPTSEESSALSAGSRSPAGGGGAGVASTTVSSGVWAIVASPAPFDPWRFALALSESIRISGADRGGYFLPAPPAATTTVVHARVAERSIAPDVSPAGEESEPAPRSAGSTPAPSATSRVEASSLAPYAVLRDWIAASNWPKALHGRVEVIVLCESRGQTTAVSPGGHVGLMQVDPRLHGPVPGDAVGQLNQGLEVFNKQGWGAWSCA